MKMIKVFGKLFKAIGEQIGMFGGSDQPAMEGEIRVKDGKTYTVKRSTKNPQVKRVFRADKEEPKPKQPTIFDRQIKKKAEAGTNGRREMVDGKGKVEDVKLETLKKEKDEKQPHELTFDKFLGNEWDAHKQSEGYKPGVIAGRTFSIETKKKHYDAVKQAMEEGKSISADVIKEYPDLMPEERAPHEMSREEFKNIVKPKLTEVDLIKRYVTETGEKINTEDDIRKVAEKYTDDWAEIKKNEKLKEEIYDWMPDDVKKNFKINQLDEDTHKNIVASALESGLDVPDNVLNDYPDLAEEYLGTNWEMRNFSAELAEGQKLEVGMIVTHNGKQYRLNENHRWERVEEEGEKESKTKQQESKLTEGFNSVLDVPLAEEAQKMSLEEFKKENGFYFEGDTSKNYYKGTAEEFYNEVREATENKEKDIEGKVQEQLDEKQGRKEFKDVNERIRMSKKEMAAYRALTKDDLSKLDNASAYKLVTKDKLIPDLNIEERKTAGELPGNIWLKKKLRDLVKTRPQNNEISRELFVEKLPEIFEVIDNAKDYEEIYKQFRDKIDFKLTNWRTHQKEFHLKDEKYSKVPLSEVFGKPFMNLLTYQGSTVQETIAEAKLKNPLSEEESRKEYADYVEIVNNNNQGIIERLKNYNDEELGGIIRDQFVSMLREKKNYNKMEKENPAGYKAELEKLRQEEIDKVNKYRQPKAYEEFIIQKPLKAPREADWGWTEAKTVDGEPQEKRIKMHDNPPLDFIKRTNGREITNEEIKTDELVGKFGYKSVQLGNYVRDKEAKEHVKYYIGSMKDMEDVLGIDLTKINKEGGLSIAFGARGGGRFKAHYEPLFKIINITKTRGDGSISHEWFHYLDHFLGGAQEGLEKNKGLLTKLLHDKVSSIEVLYDKQSNPYRETVQDVMSVIRGTDYYKKSQTEFSSSYWSDPVELFARAGEAYIYDLLEQNGMYNNYLVAGNKTGSTDGKYGDEDLANTYPQGDERIRINEAFTKLFNLIKTRGYEKVYGTPEGRINEVIDLTKSIEVEEIGFFETEEIEI